VASVPGHGRELVPALLRMVRLEAVVAHKRNFDRLKDVVPIVICHLHHFRVVVARVEDGADTEQHRLLHAQKRHDSGKQARGA